MEHNENKSLISVSVIIPVYNAEEFLRECLDSVINQTLKEIEIICVNDGSTDNSLAILEEYKQKDKRLTILMQENKGAGTARNAGLAIARGEYLYFLDADDYISLELLEKACSASKQNSSDIICFNSRYYDNSSKHCWDGPFPLHERSVPNKNSFSFHEMKENIFSTLGTLVWNKMFKKNLIDKNQIIFDEVQRTNDLYFSFCALMSAEKITVLFEHFIFYRVGLVDNCQSTNHIAPLDFYKTIIHFKQWLKKTGRLQFVEEWYYSFLLDSCLYNLLSLKDINSFKIVYEMIKTEVLPECSFGTEKYNLQINEYLYTEMKSINEQSAAEYLFNQRNTFRAERKQLQGERDQLRSERDRLQNKYDNIRASCSYRLGRMFTWLPRKILRLLKRGNKNG